MQIFTQLWKIFPYLFDVDYKVIALQLQMKLTDLQHLKDLTSEFLSFPILNFYKNHVLPSGWFPNLITHTQQVVSIFGNCILLWTVILQIDHATSTLHLQLTNPRLSDVPLLSTPLFNPRITISDVSLIDYDCFLVNLDDVFRSSCGL